MSSLFVIAIGSANLAYSTQARVWNEPGVDSGIDLYEPHSWPITKGATTVENPYCRVARGTASDAEIDACGGATINGVFYDSAAMKLWKTGGAAGNYTLLFGPLVTAITFSVGLPKVNRVLTKNGAIICNNANKMLTKEGDI